MAFKKEAILFIPGISFSPRGGRLEKLLEGLRQNQEVGHVVESGEVTLGGEKGNRLRFRFLDDTEKRVDIFESFWGDLVLRLGEKDPRKKLISGLSLLSFWFFSKVWLAMKDSLYMVGNVLVSALILAGWYYGIVVLVLAALGQNPEIFGYRLPPDAARHLSETAESMGSWKVWAFITVLLGLLPMQKIIDSAYFTMRYLKEEGLRHRVRKRVTDILESIMGDGSYERVTILAHSFGSVVAVDLLADYNKKSSIPFRIITLGSPVEFLVRRSRWLSREMERAFSNSILTEWRDFQIRGDWMSGLIKKRGESINFESARIEGDLSLLQSISSEGSEAYFVHARIIEQILK